MTDPPVPVFRPQLMRRPSELYATLCSGWWGTGPRAAAFEREFADYVGVEAGRCVMLNSCTAALHLAVKLYPDAERFLLPALTFISTAWAPRYEGKQVSFVEVGEDLCIDQDDALSKLRSPKDVVIAVHLGGHVAALDKLRQECRVIEDCAHALGSYEGLDHVGQSAGCFSFQATKGLPIGDGGMLVLDTVSQRHQVEAWAWCGIGQSTWDRAESEYRWAYQVEDVGYKYRANDVAAALALDQWPGLADSIAERRGIAQEYSEAFSDLPWLRLPTGRQGTKPNWQEYVVRTVHRDALQAHLVGRGVATTVHYYPLHLYECMDQLRFGLHANGVDIAPLKLPFTEMVWQEMLTIPCFAGMAAKEKERVVDGVRSFRP